MAAYDAPSSVIVPDFGLGTVVHDENSRTKHTRLRLPIFSLHVPLSYEVEALPLPENRFEASPPKRGRGTLLQDASRRKQAIVHPSTPSTSMTATPYSETPIEGSNTTSTKAKRVRTGCLTCRERHLKCDEAVPDCVNCRKSNRTCKRGVRLNFLEVSVYDPVFVPSSAEWGGMCLHILI